MILTLLLNPPAIDLILSPAETAVLSDALNAMAKTLSPSCAGWRLVSRMCAELDAGVQALDELAAKRAGSGAC